MKQSSPINPRAVFFTRLVIAFLLACVGSITIQAQDIVSFSIYSTANSGRNFMFPADLAGAPGVRTNNWNNIGMNVNGNSTTADAPLVPGTITNAAGVLLPNIGAVWHNASGGSISDRQAGTTNDYKMFSDAADGYNESSLSGYGYLNITNIPYTNYNVYVYFLPDNGSGSGNTRGGVFCITNTPTGTNCVYMANQTNSGANQFGQLPAPNTTTFSSNYIQSTTTSIASGGVAWSAIQGGNYGVFYGLTNANCQIFYAGLGNGSAAKDPFGNYVNGGASAVRLKVVGFQIVQVNLGAPTNIFFNPSATTMHAGDPGGTQSALFSASANGTTNNVTALASYSTSNTNVVTVSATGLMKPGTNGTANVIASYLGFFATNTVTVIGPTSLSISVVNTNLLAGNGQGDTTTATLYANFSDAANVPVNAFSFVSFSSSPSGVVTQSNSGTLTALAAGTFSVTGNYNGLSVTTNSVGIVRSWTNISSVPSFAVKLTDSSHSMLFHDLSGAPGVRSGYWNNMVQNFGFVTNQLNNPVDYQGNSLAGTLVQVIPNPAPPSELAQQVISTSTGAGTVAETTNESVMYGTFFDQGMNNGTTLLSDIVVSNIPYSSYDVYFYVYNDNSASGATRPGEFIIDGVTQYRINNPSAATQPDNNGNGYVQAAPQPGSLPASVVNVPYGNLVKFSGITDNVLTVQWGAVGQTDIGDASTVTRMRLAGFQIVKSLGGLTATNIYLSPATVPAQLAGNPATYSLTVLADFSDGTKGGNITALAGIGFASSNTNIFGVDTNGIITPGLTPGTATLTVSYQSKTLNRTVTNLAPTSVAVVALPGTVYVDGSLGLISAQASVYANFPGNTNVNIGGFSSVSFVDEGSPVCSMNAAGVITPNAVQGSANLGVSYLGTVHVSANAFTVTSIANAPVLKHEYIFTNAANSTVVVDTVGSANGMVYGPLGANKSITFDGSHAIFPGDGAYTNEPYISLQPGIINQLGDVTIEIWGGQSQRNTWARFLGFGSTGKGLTPYGNAPSTTYLQMLASYSGTGEATMFTPGHLDDVQASYSLTNGAEYQLVIVYAPNAGTSALYINGVLVGSGGTTNQPLSTCVNDAVDWLGVSLDNTDLPLAGWMNKLDIYEGALSGSQVAANYAAGQSVYLPPSSGPATNTVPVTFSVGGGNLNLSWPSDHLGWRLQVQTNTLGTGLGTNWSTVAGSTTETNTAIPINPANGAVFYRLVYP